MIATKPSPSFIAQKAFMAVVCIGLGIWGAYDLWVKIPHRLEASQRFENLTTSLKELETTRNAKAARGETVSPSEVAEYQRITNEIAAIAPGGKMPTPPSKFDHVVQWVYISCLPFGVWPIIVLISVTKQRYILEDDGSLQFTGDKTLGSGKWPQAEIASIDMSRWMAKSIAWAVHTDGSCLKLDAFTHKHLDEIVGAVAHRLHPESWQADARPTKSSGEAVPEESAASENRGDS